MLRDEGTPELGFQGTGKVGKLVRTGLLSKVSGSTSPPLNLGALS